MNIVLFGPPGAGKGTQADNLVKAYNLYKVSTGDLLRKEIDNNSPLGKKIKDIIDKGSFVSDDIINDLIKKILTNTQYQNKIIFDGYPRNLTQAKNLDILLNKNKQKIACVLSLNVNLDIVIKRILGREICSKCGLTFNKFFNPANKENHKCDSKFLQKRTDDNEEIVKNRYDTYSKETLPILKYYQNQNLLYEIEGKGEIATIYEEIRRIIRSLET